MEVVLEKSWKEKLAGEFEKPYFAELTEFVRKEYTEEKVYPAPKNIFRALDLCPFDDAKVVILGQDPYHGPGQANGLSFAVNEGIAAPPSLKNIFKEIESDLGKPPSSRSHLDGIEVRPRFSKSGDLSRWAEQGVLLLNATLTVRARSAGSHQGRGWEEFTDAIIRVLSEEREHLVFILWGNYAKSKGAHIDCSKHLVIESAHPSPFSASNGFFGSKPFSKANEYLIEHGESPIDWL
jgi:uracil-DNA glycosylase